MVGKSTIASPPLFPWLLLSWEIGRGYAVVAKLSLNQETLA